MKNILLTRSKEQSQELAEFLAGQGFKAFVEPLFSVEKFDVKAQLQSLKKSEISALIITSANAASAIIECDFPKDIRIFAVGKKSAQKLLESGFTNILFAPENSATSLEKLIIKTQKDKSGFLLYFHGSVISLDFEETLTKFDFKVKKILAYQTKEVEFFSDEFLEFSRQNSFEKVLIFSQNSAKNFINLVKKHNLLEYFQSTQILCLSQKILSEIKKSNLKNSATFSEFPILSNFYD
jgi:uroporphyrinogen-III synthase